MLTIASLIKLWPLIHQLGLSQQDTESQKENTCHTPKLSTQVITQVQTIKSSRQWWAQGHAKKQQLTKQKSE